MVGFLVFSQKPGQGGDDEEERVGLGMCGTDMAMLLAQVRLVPSAK